uniref:Putative HTH-type transcriptional regulator YdeC n=1 Tax=uncultured Bacillota bacterium TaxID=344338 RepID=A0A650EP59_9FIRM|nr:putative HTH-type transcriptional regulator YdeC [uncultured Firmicutes bacterium]
MRVTKIETDDSMRELRAHGTSAFPFEYYYDDIHSYDKQYIEYHWHNEFEWVVVESGTVDCLIGSKHIKLREGDGIFINSKAIHRFDSENGALMPNVLFAPEFISPDTSAIYAEYILPVLQSGCTHFVLRQTNEAESVILKTLNTIFKLAAENHPPKMDIQIAVCTLWRDFIKITGGYWNGKNHEQDMLLQARIRKMIQFITENYTERLTLSDIALSANISKSEALRCFRRDIQTTPVKYLIDYRLNRAKEYLISTSDTVTQIAANVGIDNISYFVRIFTKKFGVTPRAFRVQRNILLSDRENV